MKRVLILSYYWPPSGGSGVQRWLKFVKYLRDFGWEPVVYTALGGEMPAIDSSLEKEVPDGVEVIRRPIWEPYGFYKRVMGISSDTSISAGFTSESEKSGLADSLGKWVRGNFFIPDARRFWIRPSIKHLSEWLKANRVDAIVSTGPPHSMHLIALGLRRRTALPWLADFRDPWTDIDFYKELHLTGMADRKHHRLEREVLKNADAVVAVSSGMARGLEKKYPCQCRILTNGFDEDDMPDALSYDSGNGFVLLHAGTLGPDRNSPVFWKALGEEVKACPALASELKIRLIGKTDVSAMASIQESGLESLTEHVAYMSHAEILGEMSRASVQLLFINNTPNAEGILTGKVFEYLMCGRPVLGVGPKGGDADFVLEDSGAGTLFGFTDAPGMKQEIRRLFELHKSGELHGSDPARISKYSRRTLTGGIAGILDGISS